MQSPCWVCVHMTDGSHVYRNSSNELAGALQVVHDLKRKIRYGNFRESLPKIMKQHITFFLVFTKNMLYSYIRFWYANIGVEPV